MVKISVIIPIYNVENYIEECLDSVINQTLKDIEIICVNDGSTDGTLNILERYAKKDNRIKLINQENSGLSVSRNVGLDHATGEYVCFLDSDDYFELESFEELYNIASEKKLDFVFFKLINFDDETKVKERYEYFDLEYLKDVVGDKVFNYNDVSNIVFSISVTAPGKLFNHDFIRGMRFPEGLIYEDNPFFIEAMFKAKRVYLYDKYLYNRRVRSTSLTRSNTEKFSDCISIFNLLTDITKSFGLYDKYKVNLYNKKLYNTYRIFKLVNEEDKEDFFNKINEDFSNFQEEYESDPVFNALNNKLKLIFRSGIYSETYEEFELTIENHDLRFKNKDLKKKNSNLKKEIKSIKTFNEQILNSNSWKITKPFRKFVNIFRS